MTHSSKIFLLALLLLAACQNNSTERGKIRPYVNHREGNSTDTMYELYSPIIAEDTTFRDVWWQLKAPKLQNGRLSFYYKRPQGLLQAIECVSFGHNGLLLLHGAYSAGMHMSSGLIMQDREIATRPINYVFYGEEGTGYLGYNWAEKSTNTDEHTRKVLSYDSTGNVTILNKEGTLTTYGHDRYAQDISDSYTERSKIDKGYADRTYIRATEVSSGTYSPTVTKISNVASITIEEQGAHYTRLGNQVNVAIALYIKPADGNSLTSFTISLPVPASFATAANCTGTINAQLDATKAHGIAADTKNNTAIIQYTPAGNSRVNAHINFTYTVR